MAKLSSSVRSSEAMMLNRQPERCTRMGMGAGSAEDVPCEGRLSRTHAQVYDASERSPHMYATIAFIGLMTLSAPAASSAALTDTSCAIVETQQDPSCDPSSEEPSRVTLPQPGKANPNPSLPPQPCLRPRREVPRAAVTLARALVELAKGASR
jgi:hypothetical protein